MSGVDGSGNRKERCSHLRQARWLINPEDLRDELASNCMYIKRGATLSRIRVTHAGNDMSKECNSPAMTGQI